MILLSSSNQIAGEELKGALDEVARHRQVELQPLRQVLDGYPVIAQHRWDRWLQRQGLGDRIPSDFAEILESVFGFSEPDSSAAPRPLSRYRQAKPGLPWISPADFE